MLSHTQPVMAHLNKVETIVQWIALFYHQRFYTLQSNNEENHYEPYWIWLSSLFLFSLDIAELSILSFGCPGVLSPVFYILPVLKCLFLCSFSYASLPKWCSKFCCHSSVSVILIFVSELRHNHGLPYVF